MRKGLLALVTYSLCFLTAFAQTGESARIAPRSTVIPYDDEASIMKLAYRDSPYYLELTGSWSQKQTDSSIVYTRQIDADKVWREYRVTLNVRCGHACCIYLNRQAIGYGDDSRHWNEFDLTDYLKYGKENTLSIEALKHPLGAQLERDDLQVGLNGDPFLLFKSDPSLSDFSLTADYDAVSGSGTLAVDATVFNSRKKGKYYLEVELWDPRGHTFDRMGRWVVFDKKREASVDLSRSWNNVQSWSAETPALYTAVLRLRNEAMEEEEVIGARFGFRRVEIKDGLLQLNGKPITLKGVTYGLEHTEGYSARQRIRQDLLSMKYNNVNAVRTAPYSPQDPFFYQLCDSIGFYVVCDANLLPTSTQRLAVATDKDYIPLFEQRVENLYGKYKNQTSIIAWSLGDTRDNGICMAAAYKRLKALEKNRPVIFSGADFSATTDIIALANPTVQQLRQTLSKTSDRPFLIIGTGVDEYDDLWRQVETSRALQGAFLVSFHQLSSTVLRDLKSLYSPFDVHLVKTTIDDAEFTIYNRNDFSDFSQYILDYTIFTNLRPNISAGDLPVAINGGGVDNAKLRIPPVSLQPGEELFIRFDLSRRKKTKTVVTDMRELGTVVFPLPYQEQPKSAFINGNQLASDSVANAPRMQFQGHHDWTSQIVAETRRKPYGGSACIDVMRRYMTPAGSIMCDVRETFTIFASGDMIVDYTINPTDLVHGSLIPEFVVDLDASTDTLRWFGQDREALFAYRNAAVVGVNESPRSKLNGAKLRDLRWCATESRDAGHYVELLNEHFTLHLQEGQLVLTPNDNTLNHRLHLRDYERSQSPSDFYWIDYPVVSTGILEPPVITSAEVRFASPLTVEITSPSQGQIRYTLDGSEPTGDSPLYTSPFQLTTTTVVKARVYADGMPPSFTTTRKFNYDYIVRTDFSRKPNTPFNVGADTLLFDGEQGTVDDLTQGWLGFSGAAVSTTVQLSKPVDVENITLRFAHVPDSWAFAPRSLSVILSTDGVNYTDTLMVTMPFDPASKDNDVTQVVEISIPVGRQAVASFKINPSTLTNLPAWHRAKGLKPWLLMDEIVVGESTSVKKETP